MTGKYKPNQAPPTDSRAADDRQNQFIRRFLDNPRLLERVQSLIPIAERNGCTMSQLALAWALRRPEVTSCIIGASRPAQLVENVKASGLKIGEQDLAAVGAVGGVMRRGGSAVSPRSAEIERGRRPWLREVALNTGE